MLLEISKYIKYINKNLLNRHRLNYLILYATSKCNAFCSTCFFHKNLNRNDDLSLKEYKKISRKLGDISMLLLSGGEPFLREDLVEICRTYIQNNKIDTLSIPTNGSLSKEIVEMTERLAKEFPKTVISINPSLDGMREYHDMSRGLGGSFERVISTIKGLEKLKAKYKNVQIIVNSVINRDNIHDLEELIEYLAKFNLDYHAFEIMRGDRRDKNLGLPDAETIRMLHKRIVKNRETRITNILEKIVVIGSLKYLHKIKEDVLEGRKWPMSCSAGRSILAVYPNGDVGLCEIKRPIGNLRDNDYDLKKLLAREEPLKEIRELCDNRCSCTHICFLNASIAKEWKTIFKILWYFIRDDQRNYSHI